MSIIIRCPRRAETEIMTDVILRSKRANGYDDAFMDKCKDELAVTPERLAAREYWVADEHGIICGCACLVADIDQQIGEIHTFFVDPNHQRKGIGRLLLAQVLRRAKEQGLTKLRLDADPAALEFYQAMGFEIIGQTPSGSIPGRFLPLMERTISVGSAR